MGKPQKISKVVNGIVYYYERTPYYDPALKNTKYHYKYIGKMVDGKISKVRSTLPKASYIYGPFIPLLKIVKDLQIDTILEKFLNKQETELVLSIAMAKVVRALPIKNTALWLQGTYLSKRFNINPSASELSRLIDKIGSSSLYRDFSKELIKNLNPKESILYDITSIPSYSKLPIFEYGHPKDHEELPQINLAMVMEKIRSIPLGFEIYPGSIPDMVTLERFANTLGSLISSILLVLDRGFFKYENLKSISRFDYIIAASQVRKEVKTVFAKSSSTVQKAKNVMIYGEQAMFCKEVTLRIEDMNLKGYFYYDPVREGEEKEEFHRKLSEKMDQIEKLELRRGVMDVAKEIAGTYSKYLQVIVKDNKIIAKPRDKAISAIEHRMGKFLLVYQGNYTGLECLMYYRERDNIEKAFEMLKNDLEIFPLRGKRVETIRGTIFVQFIALIMRLAMLKKMRESGLLKKYSLDMAIIELEKLHIIEKDDGSIEELERTKRQKMILEAFAS